MRDYASKNNTPQPYGGIDRSNWLVVRPEDVCIVRGDDGTVIGYLVNPRVSRTIIDDTETR